MYIVNTGAMLPRVKKGWLDMKNYMLKIWVATPDCAEMQHIEFCASDFKDIKEYIDWKREQLADKWGKNGFICRLDTAWEVHEIYPWCKY